MKPTQVTELLANIRKTFVSFFSILMFVALGVGIFLGITWVAPAMQSAADDVFEEGSFHDAQIQFVYGLTDDDLAQLAEVEGVTDVEAGYQSFQTAAIGEKALTVKLQSLGERIDTPAIVEGELPAQADEIAVVASAAKEHDIAVGDVIAFENDETADDQTATLDDTTDGAADDTTGASADVSAGDDMKYLNGASYKVTAIVNSPEYVATSSATYGVSTSASGSVDLVAWAPTSAFDAAAFQNGYPIVSVRCDSLRGASSFSDDYAQAAKAVVDNVSALGDTLAEKRYDDLHDQAQAKIDEAQAKLDEGKRQIADGEKQLEEGRAQLETKRAEGEAQLASAYDLLIYYETLKQEGEKKLAEEREMIAEGEKALEAADELKSAFSSSIADYRARGNAAKAKFENSDKTDKDRAVYDAELDALGAEARNTLLEYAGKAGETLPTITHQNYFETLDAADALVARFEDVPIEYRGQTMTVSEARAKLTEGKQQLAEVEVEYNEKVAQLNDGWAQYYAGRDELDRAVAEGEQQLSDGEAKVADAKKQVADNEPKLEAAKEQLAAMKDYAWTVLGRSSNIGAGEIDVFSGVTTNLSFSMALLFVIVGLLVSYSAVSRIVHEQVTQIGTKKALGLRSREITMSFLLYAGLAVLLGAIIGTVVGVIAVEGIIANALKSMFTFGAFPPHFGPAQFLAVTLLELALVLGATWLACRSILKQHAVELLHGEKPPEAKTRFYEKWKVWDRLPLFTQTIVNNCVNDKRRVFSTIVGVAGCTALIVTAITLNNDVLKSYDRHYEDVYGFDSIAYVDPAASGSATEVEGVFQDAGGDAAQALHKSFLMSNPDGSGGAVRVIVPYGDDAFRSIYHVNTISGGEVDLSQDGVWVSQAYRDHFGAQVGDTIALDSGDGTVHEVPILGFYEFWLTYHELVMGRDYYEREFDTTLAPNAVLGNAEAGGGIAALDFGRIDGFDSAVDDKAKQYGNFATFSTVSSAVVLIYLALSALMAVVVLLNLNVMFIEEKKRDLIVLMINGFSVKDAKRYIYNDTIVLTAIGIAGGLVLGCVMGAVTVGSMEPSTASFVKDVDPTAVLVGVFGSAILAAIMCVIALRRIPKFNLTDINKF